MKTININRLFNTVNNSLFMTTGKLDYSRITDAIIKLSNEVIDFEGEGGDIWYIGEGGNCCLMDLITGAYWHYTEWHGGQYSKGYAALSVLGQIYSPNMEDVDIQNDAYTSLHHMAEVAK